MRISCEICAVPVRWQVLPMCHCGVNAGLKEAVKAALIEAMPLLLEHREAAPAMPTSIAEPVELMRDGTPFKKLDFDDIPSMGGILK